MKQNILLFFYGTLKEGHYNHTRFNLHDPLVGHVFERGARVDGYTIDVSTGLPRAFPDGRRGSMTGDLYMMHDLEVLAVIINMELAAGYKIRHVEAYTSSGTYDCLLFPTNVVPTNPQTVSDYKG